MSTIASANKNEWPKAFYDNGGGAFGLVPANKLQTGVVTANLQVGTTGPLLSGSTGQIIAGSGSSQIIINSGGVTIGGSPVGVGVVHLTGSETITGLKTFQNDIYQNYSGNPGDPPTIFRTMIDDNFQIHVFNLSVPFLRLATNGALLRDNTLPLMTSTSDFGIFLASRHGIRFTSQNSASPPIASIDANNLTTSRGYSLPDSGGTLALTSGQPSVIMTTLGDIMYENSTPAPTRLAGNTTSTKKYLSQTGTGAVSAAPAWAQIAAADLSNGVTGSGSVVLATSPTLTTPTIGVATATSINKVAITAPATSATLTIANSKTLTVNNTLALSGTDSTTMTFPSTNATIARTDAAQTFTGNQTFDQTIQTPQAITVAANAGTADINHGSQTFTNSSAAAMTITLATASAVDGQMKIIRIYDASAVAQGITWVNTENSTVSVPGTSNGSTTLPLTVIFMFNGATSKWRCIQVA